MSNRQRTGEDVEFVPVKKAKAKAKAAKVAVKALSLDQASDQAAKADQAPLARTAAEQGAVDRTAQRRAEKGKLPVITKHEKAGFNFSHEAGDSTAAFGVLQDVFATGDPALTAALIDQLANLTRVNEQYEPFRLKALLSFVRALRPENEAEGLLAVQMAAVHDSMMRAAESFRSAKQIELFDSASKAVNKLARTYTMQMDTLKRIRTKEQSIHVHHHSREGGGGGEQKARAIS